MKLFIKTAFVVFVTLITAGEVRAAVEEDIHGNRLSLDDPDAGTITSQYNEFGELLKQTDANGVISEYKYDTIGRVLQYSLIKPHIDTTITTYAYDDSNIKGTLLSETVYPNNTAILYTYDTLARLIGKTYIADGDSLSYSYTYNNKGQLENVVYPFGFTINHQYDDYGRLKDIKHGNDTIYSLQSFSVFGTPDFWWTGSKMGTAVTLDEYGLMTAKMTGTKKNVPFIKFGLSDSSIQSFEYGYDVAGRMSVRAGNPLLLDGWKYYKNREYFTHDKSDRLVDADLQYLTGIGYLDTNGQFQYASWYYDMTNLFTANYDQNLMTSNSAVGTYDYNSHRPHALTDVNLYDSNTISFNRCDLTYTLFNKVKTINEGDFSYDIKYYPNGNQAVSTLKENGTIISQKQYAGKAFEIDYATDKKYFYVYADGQPIAVFIQEGENEIEPYFIYTDHLGSVDVITDQNGNIVDEMSFDVWGNRRDRQNWSQKDTSNHLIDRGFTGHQHLDKFALINMGGRVYDPVVQQFLSPDPYVQMAENPLNYNRYAYALFNPLHWTDPTGEKMKGWGWFFTLLDPISVVTTALVAGSTVAGIAGMVGGITYATTIANAPIMMTFGAIFTNFDSDKILSNAFRINNGLFVTDKNKNFLGRTWEFTSRFTWEALQTGAGYYYTQGKNMISFVDRVDYFGGATFATQENTSGSSVSLSNYINIKMHGEIKGKFSDYILTDRLFLHEYGHTKDSKAFGISYLFAVGIPSAISAGRSEKYIAEWQEKNSTNLDPHDVFWTEIRANKRAAKYVKKYYGMDWETLFPDYLLYNPFK